MASNDGAVGLRRFVYDAFEQDHAVSALSRWVARGIVVIVIVNLAAMILASVPELDARYGRLFDAVEYVSLAVFAVEYVLRVWSTVEHAPYLQLTPLRARLGYMASGAGIIDLLSVLPFVVVPFFPADLRPLILFGAIRFLKIARYSAAVRSLLTALYNERRTLVGCFVILFGATVTFAALMYMLERTAQPDRFGTIPDAMWWAIVTLCTVGYGDTVPVTPAGKFVAGFAIIGGIMIFALPVAIIATAFSEEIRRRDFIVTWTMVARVPLFSALGAREIGDIMRLLRAQVVEAGRVIVRRGEPATCMYFITAGDVRVELPNENVALGVGHFFGEMALLHHTNRSATVAAVTRTNLLVLDAHDFHALIERSPQIAKLINEVAKSRASGPPAAASGDIVAEEIAGGEAARTGETSPS